jgi:hypothetical protein
MTRKYFGALVAFCFLSTTVPAFAAMTGTHTIYHKPFQNKVRASTGATSPIQDETDKIDVWVDLYLDYVIFNIPLADDHEFDIRENNEPTITAIATAEVFNPTAGCKYCADFEWETYWNTELDESLPPVWLWVEHFEITRCLTLPPANDGE